MTHKDPESGTSRLWYKERLAKNRNAHVPLSNSQIIVERMEDQGIKLVYLLHGVLMIKCECQKLIGRSTSKVLTCKLAFLV